MIFLKRHLYFILVFVAMALVLFLATYKLLESPPTWFDEGQITQVAMNIIEHPSQALLQVAPGQYMSASFITSSFPLTFPLAAVMYFFGMNLLAARIVMVLFLLLFVVCAWRFSKKEMPLYESVAALFLLATFAPMYGHGKNVLGEIPGLLYAILFLLCVIHIETKKSTHVLCLLAGLLLGLAVATKPIFLLFLPPVFVLAIYLYARRLLTIQKIIAGCVGFLVPMILWMQVQFNGETLGQVFTFYFNPYGNDVSASIAHNALLFVTQLQPLYALVLLLVWTASIAQSIYRRERISYAESIAFGFSLLVYAAFLRTQPYYRYFFPGEIFALLYLPLALSRLWPQRVPLFLMKSLVVLLIAFQLYQCFFNSWVATFYRSHRTAEMTRVLGSLPVSASIFIYQAPEVPIFLPDTMPYYQYFTPTKTMHFGTEQVPLIAQGIPDFVVFLTEQIPAVDLSHYQKSSEFDRYSLWQKK